MDTGSSAVTKYGQGLTVYVLEKLKRFHGASSVGEEQPQVILRHVLSIKINKVMLWDAVFRSTH